MNKVFSYPDVCRVVVCGDIHGNFRGILYKLCLQYGLTDTLLIVAGDCGFGFEKIGYYERVYSEVAGRLRKSNCFVVFVRGNHDNPAYFAEQRIAWERFRCIPDYSVVRACAHNILCVGGAVSIDRSERRQTNERLLWRGFYEVAAWWPDEAPVYNEAAVNGLLPEIPVDIVVTHSAPSFVLPLGKSGLAGWAAADPELYADLSDERETLDLLYYSLMKAGHPLSHWFYGHFHESWNGSYGQVLFHMLDIEEIKEIL